MAVTAKRNDMRLLAVVLGEEVSKVRNQETTELLDYGFNLYKVNIVKEKGTTVKTVKLDKGSKEKVDIVLNEDITILSKKSDKDKIYNEKIIIDDIKLPLSKNQEIGKLELYDGNNKIGTYSLIIKEDVKKKNLIKVFLDNLKDIIVGDLIS